MKKPPKFLNAKNDLARPGEVFIVHTGKPAFVAQEVPGPHDVNFEIHEIESLDSIRPERMDGVVSRLRDWLIAQKAAARPYYRKQSDSRFRYPRSSYYITENILDWDGQLAITKLSPPAVFVRFPNADAYFADFEQFRDSLAVVEWLGEKPDPDEQEAILIDCYNFLVLHDMVIGKSRRKINK